MRAEHARLRRGHFSIRASIHLPAGGSFEIAIRRIRRSIRQVVNAVGLFGELLDLLAGPGKYPVSLPTGHRRW
jgi:hypothetical protein